MTNSIRPNLWFDTQAEEAARYYTGIFKDSKMGEITRYPDAGQEITGGKPGQVLTAEFELNGTTFIAINGGPQFKFSEAVSFEIMCKDQAEVDYYWDKLGEGGDPSAQQCGWLKDKYGVSWQVVPQAFYEMVNTQDTEKRNRTFEAMLQMKKLDLAELQKAYDGVPVS
jgi:predicted 3-demethylubiquinone-9 3-methyltransferase (glyoxalase superfamily)